jgi:CheY-like chemotaxis protein
MKKIIIAESVLSTVENSNTLFSRGGIMLSRARTSEEILELHRAGKADLIVTDFELPAMGGGRLCSLIRGDDALRDVSLVMVCDSGGPSASQCLQAGANAVMTKPVDPLELFSRISDLLVIPRRQDMRAYLHVSVAGRKEKTSFPGVTRNISISGMLLETHQELPPGERLICTVVLGGRRIEIECEIRRVEKATAGHFRFGVKFLNLDTKSLILIEQLAKGKAKQ